MANHDTYVIKGSSLDAIAAEVKTLADTSDKMTVNQITSNIAQANANVEVQTDIIEQIKMALAGKTTGVKEEQEKTINITENGTVIVTPDEEDMTLSSVTVNVEIESDCGENILDSIFDATITEFYSLKDLTAYSTQTIGNLFNGCGKMVKWAMPNLTKELNYSFRYCSKLTYIDIGKPATCAHATFYGKPLKGVSVVVRSEIPPTLSGAFTGTSFDNTTVFYVPKNSIDAYKSATNWSTYADCYKAIEDYPEITGGII